ncbi:hypothetical protein vseg_014274 [Gypsophila vaccaria]
MLAMSPLFPSLGWEYPMEFNLDNCWNLDSIVLPPTATTTNNKLSTYQIQINNDNNGDNDEDDQTVVKKNKKKRSESPGSASSTDHICGNVLAKKLNHNASERDRRRKINDLYSTLRALLPTNDHSKKLSIPSTVGRVLKYIPDLQKEVDDLIQRKDDLLSKCSLLQGVPSEFVKEEKPKMKDVLKENRFCSISASKLGDNEIIIQISSFDNISLPDVLLKLEMDGLMVLDVSSFQSFGGSTFYNIHLWIEGGNSVNCDVLNEELPYFIYQQNMNTNMNTNVNIAQAYTYY